MAMKLHFLCRRFTCLGQGGQYQYNSGSGEPSDKFAWIILRDDLVRLVFCLAGNCMRWLILTGTY